MVNTHEEEKCISFIDQINGSIDLAVISSLESILLELREYADDEDFTLFFEMSKSEPSFVNQALSMLIRFRERGLINE